MPVSDTVNAACFSQESCFPSTFKDEGEAIFWKTFVLTVIQQYKQFFVAVKVSEDTHNHMTAVWLNLMWSHKKAFRTALCVFMFVSVEFGQNEVNEVTVDDMWH